MAKTKEQKKQALDKLNEKMDQAKGIVFSSFDQVGVAEIETLRSELRQNDSEMVVVKKSLLKKILAERKIEGLNTEESKGNFGVIMGYQDEVAPAKVTDKFKKTNEGLVFQGGILEGKYISIEEIQALALLPGKEELIAKVIGSLNAPVSNFVGVLNGVLRDFVGVLNAVKESKE